MSSRQLEPLCRRSDSVREGWWSGSICSAPIWLLQKPNAEMHWLCYDVFSEDLAVYLKKNWPGFHVVLSDMAPRTTGSQYADHQQSLRLAGRVLELATLFLHQNGTVYCKVFQGEDFPQFLKECTPLFASVKVVKPKSSRQESREVFLLCRGFRREG
jgi:23S rRNA (uridine2552-2'-O)-methyltransferase